MNRAFPEALRTPERGGGHVRSGSAATAVGDGGPESPAGHSLGLRSPPEKKRRSALHKTEMCVFHVLFMAGQGQGCLEGSSCSYAHSQDELCLPSLEDKERRRLIPSAQRFKTELCEKWVTTGTCPYQMRCTFSHDHRMAAIAQPGAHTAVRSAVALTNRAAAAHSLRSQLFEVKEEYDPQLLVQPRPSRGGGGSGGDSTGFSEDALPRGLSASGAPLPPLPTLANDAATARLDCSVYSSALVTVDALRAAAAAAAAPATPASTSKALADAAAACLALGVGGVSDGWLGDTGCESVVELPASARTNARATGLTAAGPPPPPPPQLSRHFLGLVLKAQAEVAAGGPAHLHARTRLLLQLLGAVDSHNLWPPFISVAGRAVEPLVAKAAAAQPPPGALVLTPRKGAPGVPLPPLMLAVTSPGAPGGTGGGSGGGAKAYVDARQVLLAAVSAWAAAAASPAPLRAPLARAGNTHNTMLSAALAAGKPLAPLTPPRVAVTAFPFSLATSSSPWGASPASDSRLSLDSATTLLGIGGSPASVRSGNGASGASSGASVVDAAWGEGPASGGGTPQRAPPPGLGLGLDVTTPPRLPLAPASSSGVFGAAGVAAPANATTTTTTRDQQRFLAHGSSLNAVLQRRVIRPTDAWAVKAAVWGLSGMDSPALAGLLFPSCGTPASAAALALGGRSAGRGPTRDETEAMEGAHLPRGALFIDDDDEEEGTAQSDGTTAGGEGGGGGGIDGASDSATAELVAAAAHTCEATLGAAPRLPIFVGLATGFPLQQLAAGFEAAVGGGSWAVNPFAPAPAAAGAGVPQPAVTSATTLLDSYVAFLAGALPYGALGACLSELARAALAALTAAVQRLPEGPPAAVALPQWPNFIQAWRVAAAQLSFGGYIDVIDHVRLRCAIAGGL